jgi:hypothetical protein
MAAPIGPLFYSGGVFARFMVFDSEVLYADF